MIKSHFQSFKKHAIAWLICFLLAASSAYALVPSEGIPSPSGPLSSVSAFAGSGEYDDADVEIAADQASFRFPGGLAVLDDGSILLSDSENQVIRRIKDGVVTVYAGFISPLKDAMGIPAGALIDGSSTLSSFQSPAGLAVDGDGNVYVADAGNHAVRKIDPDGNVTTVAGTGDEGYKDGAAGEAQFHSPMGVAVAADGTLYVADTGNHVLRKITVDGEVTTLNALPSRKVEIAPDETVAAGDYRDGKLAQALFNEPVGLVMDEQGNLIVSDSGNHLIRYVNLAEGQVTTLAGVSPQYEENALYASEGYADGAAKEAMFYFPKGMALTADGGLVIADSMNHAVRFLHEGAVVTLAGNPAEGYGAADGINGRNRLHFPTDVAVTEDMILIADTYNHVIRAYTLYDLPEEAADRRLKIVYDDEVLVLSAADVFLSEGRTMASAEALAEAIGWEAALAGEDQGGTATLSAAGRTVIFTIGNETVVIRSAGDESEISMDVRPIRIGDRVFVPVRYAAEIFGFHVGWDGATQSVILR